MSFHVVEINNPAKITVDLGRIKINDQTIAARAEASKLGQFVPDGGKVSFIFLTDKQFGMTINFFGSFHTEDSPDAPEQLLLF